MAISNFEMGTGKTCTAVGVAEQFIKAKSASFQYPTTIIKNIVVLTKGKGLQNNFINEIANVCTSGQYLSNVDKYIKNKEKRIRKNIKVNYTFNTFEIFAKNLKKISSNEKKTLYENTLFIIDEAHNLRVSTDIEESNIYKEIYTLFELLSNRKILLLTGTPMKDKPEEIVDLLNLILKNKLTIDDLNNVTNFKEKIGGYVSYLRAMMSDVNRREEGVLLGTLNHFKVYPVVMNEFQSKVYLEAKKKDDFEKSIYNHSRQSTLLVFPDGTYGKQGFEKNVISTSSGDYKFASSYVREQFTTNLEQFSAIYSNLIKNLQHDYENGKSSFVFCEFVKGSGLIVLGLLLELHGFTKATANSNFSKPQKRFVTFTNETSTDSQTRKLIAVSNNSKNMKGEYISTIIGSRVIMEGFSFKNKQKIYILTPHWNYSETSQVIARGLRVGSHNDLIKTGVIPEVEIYHYVTLPSSKNLSESIDLHMYQIAENKDLKIQKVMRTLKESAFDCVLNKERNTIVNLNLDNTRNCEYSSCEYKCDNIFKIDHDNRNYKLLYFRLSEDYFKLKNIIINKVIKQPITIQDVMDEVNNSYFEIMLVLQDLLYFQEMLFFRPEGAYYLANVKNLYYASNINNDSNDNINDVDDPFLLNFYTKFSTVFIGKSIEELIHTHQNNFMVSLVDKIFESGNLIELQKNVVQLPLYLQEKLLCYSISSYNKDIDNKFVRDMVLNNFKLYYKIIDKNAYVWLNGDNYKCTKNLENYKFWKPCNSQEQFTIEQMKKEGAQSKIVNNPYGYIGLLNRNSNDFCLRKIDDENNLNVDKRKRNIGKRCQNWKKVDLVNLVSNRLKVTPDDDFDFDENDITKMENDPKFKNLLNIDNGTLKDYKRLAFWNAQDINYLCSRIMQNFMDKKLVIDDPNCGTSKKIR